MNRKHQGFTLIEVLIVLAIAGLIIVMLFVGIPSLQRNSRNHYRKRATDLIHGQMMQYYATTGSLPATVAEGQAFVEDYVEDTASKFTVVFRDNNGDHSDKPDYDEIYLQYGHWCTSAHGGADYAGDLISAAPGSHDGNKIYAVYTKLEKNFYYCLDNG